MILQDEQDFLCKAHAARKNLTGCNGRPDLLSNEGGPKSEHFTRLHPRGSRTLLLTSIKLDLLKEKI